MTDLPISLKAYALLVAGLLLLSACGGGGTTSTVTLNSDADWVAFQDGPSGTWKVVSPDTAGGRVYTLHVTDAGGLYGVATHRTTTTGTEQVDVLQASVTDGTTVDLDLNNDQKGTVNVSVTGLGSGESAVLYVPGQTIAVTGNTAVSPFYGTDDLIALHYSAPGGTGNLLGAVIDRGIAVSATPASASVDFTAPNLTFGATHTYSANGGAMTVSFATAAGTSARLSDGAGNYSTISNAQSTDRYKIIASGTSAQTIRYLATTPDPGNLSIDLTTVNAYSGTMSSTTLGGLSYTAAAGGPALDAYVTTVSQGRTPAAVSWEYALTPAWLGSTATYALPNFDSLSGYSTNWDITPGTPVSGYANAVMYNGASFLTAESQPAPVSGQREDIASKSINFTP